MKKSLAIFIVIILCALTVLIGLPLYVMREADRVQVTEQVFLGDSSMVEGVTITSHSHYDGELFWDTEYTAGTKPQAETEQFFYLQKKAVRNDGMPSASWYGEGGYQVFSLNNKLSGGFDISSSGSLTVEGWDVGCEELVEAYEVLAAETGPGEKKTREIVLKDYMEYVPIGVTLNLLWQVATNQAAETLEEAYNEYFKIPVPDAAGYRISVTKNAEGKITGMSGMSMDQEMFFLSTACTASDTDLYFTFYNSSADGSRINTSLIPGDFGVYRQPYSVVDGELVADPSELSMVYSLEGEVYPYGSVFLDVTEDGELLILSDREEVTVLQTVDLENMELLQRTELKRPEESPKIYSVVRMKEDFFVLWYGNGYISLVDKTAEQGYAQRLLFAVKEDDPLFYHNYVNENDMDWNGEQLVYACYSKREYSGVNDGNLELAVYDNSGLIFHGKYNNSLQTEQEYTNRGIRGEKNNWHQSCEPRKDISLTVEWPE